MNVDISKWEKTAHGPDGESTSKRNNFPYANAVASHFLRLGFPSVTIMGTNFLIIICMQPSPKQPSTRLFAALNTEVK